MVDRDLDRSSRRLGKPGWWFLALGAAIAAVGVVLIVVTRGVGDAIGIALVVLAAVPGSVGIALVVSGLVSWWAARGKPFA
jgi:hypothetical protein